MARKAAASGTMLDRFRYAPGDGHVYVWGPGDGDTITVHRIKRQASMAHPGLPGGTAIGLSSRLDLEDTGDRIPVPAQPTATAMADAVDAWRDGAR